MSLPLPYEMESSAPVPDRIHGYVSVTSQGGTSCLQISSLPRSTEAFHARKKDFQAAEKALNSAGFTMVARSRLGIAIAGPPDAYEELTGGKLVTRERLVYAEAGAKRYITHLDITGNKQPKVLGCGVAKSPSTQIEAVLVERPRTPHGIWPPPLPPSASGYYLRVPDDVSVGLGAAGAHALGFRGQGVAVAMVDTGQAPHPFFTAHQYRISIPISMVPGASPHKDPIGHGTGESANIFALAPDVQLQPIRASNNQGDLVAAIGGFLKAKELRPAVLTNSWGGDQPYPPSGPLDSQDLAWALEIQDAVEQGILVIFSAGNGQFGVEPQVAEVLAAGGVYMTNTFDLRASNYASGYSSPFFPGRVVPDACGLVGLLPRAAYIMLPIPPGCEIDVEMSAADEDGNAGDGTTANDGWGLFSGTSAAAPQLAGVAALVLSAKPGLRPAQVVEALKSTATDVRTGNCHPRFNNPAKQGPDEATGAGLVNASAAVQYALDHW